MKFNKILTSLALGSLLFGMSACTEEVEYTPAEPVEVPEFFFQVTNALHHDLEDGQRQITLTVARSHSDGPATVAIESSADNPTFVCPPSVSFADGVGVANYVISFDINQIELNKNYYVDLAIPGVENSQWAYGSMHLEIIYLPWQDVELPEDAANQRTTALYRDGLCALFGYESDTYEVKIQQSPIYEGLYRLVNPWGPGSTIYNYLNDEGLTYDTSKNYYLVIDARNPKAVIMPYGDTGVIDPEAGMLYYGSWANTLLAGGNSPSVIESNLLYANLKDGIITFDSKSPYIDQTMLISERWKGNLGSNPFKVVLPGYDDQKEWEDVGMCDFTDGFVGPFFGIKDNKYKIRVQKNLLERGVYKLVDPWGYYSSQPSDVTYDMIVNAAHPEFVTFEEACSGYIYSQSILYVEGLADFMMTYQGYSINDCQAEDMGGTMVKNVITLPGDQVVGLLVNPQTGKASVDFPEDEYLTDVVIDLNNPEPVPAEVSVKAVGKKKSARRFIEKRPLIDKNNIDFSGLRK